MGEIAIETLAEEMYQMVAECAGKKNLKATDLTKEMIAKHGEGACDKEDCKKAIRLLIAAGRLLNAARRFASQKKGVRSQESGVRMNADCYPLWGVCILTSDS